jgi:hypothetical protein
VCHHAQLFSAKFKQTFQELTIILLTSFYRIERDGAIPYSSYKVSIYLLAEYDRKTRNKTIDQYP